jgi:TrmH family RNA methyltransferase
MDSPWRKAVRFVLVEPSDPRNIGAAARAIKNMGFSDLALVNPRRELTKEAVAMAHNAEDVLRAARTFQTLAEAVADCALVVGTTRRTGRKRGLLVPIEEGSARIVECASGGGRVALLLGREHRGLFNHETEECGFVLSIPTSPEQPSLNLAQAAVLFAYELSKAGRAAAPLAPPTGPPSTHAEQEALCARLVDILDLVGYTRIGSRDVGRAIRGMLKRIVSLSRPTRRDIGVMIAVASRVQARLGDPAPVDTEAPPGGG